MIGNFLSAESNVNGQKEKVCLFAILNKTKVIRANLLDFDFDFEDISVLVTSQFW